MAKTLAEIEKALQERYDGRLDEKKGMTYAAWEDITYAANRIFGPLGWSRTFVVAPYKLDDGYACVLRVTVYFIDEKGNYDSITNEAPGYNELSYMNGANGREPMTDTAFKGCYADALKKNLQALGDAFGLFIGAEAKAEKAAAKAGNGAGYQRSSGGTDKVAPRQGNGNGNGNGGGRPTEKQLNTLRKAGCPEGELEGIGFEDASAMISKVASNGWKWDANFGSSPAPKAKPAAKAPATPAPTFEDIPDDGLPF